MEREVFDPARLARMDQSMARIDDDINAMVDWFDRAVAKCDGDETYVLAMQVTACNNVMVEAGISPEQIGVIPLVTARLIHRVWQARNA